MKVSTYPVRRRGFTSFIHAGSAVDSDLQGGLEEVIMFELNSGMQRVVINLEGMHFFHATLLSCLLETERKLREVNGELILASVPGFVRYMMNKMDICDRFSWVRNPWDVEKIERTSKMISAERGFSSGEKYFSLIG